MKRLGVGIVAILMLLGLTFAPAHAEEAKGFFGLTVDIEVKGFMLNPTLKTVTVKKVEPRSPAADAGIVAGDQIVEAEGRMIAGTKASELEPIMSKKVGQPLHLLLKRPKGEYYKTTLIAVARPAGK
ncbi:MAG TPA: PDZ domain-containing protein [Thermoanaerobaculia bacterium]|nr:PDZ domain-containing protein [Thermoanaerobaculia bacterium]